MAGPITTKEFLKRLKADSPPTVEVQRMRDMGYDPVQNVRRLAETGFEAIPQAFLAGMGRFAETPIARHVLRDPQRNIEAAQNARAAMEEAYRSRSLEKGLDILSESHQREPLLWQIAAPDALVAGGLAKGLAKGIGKVAPSGMRTLERFADWVGKPPASKIPGQASLPPRVTEDASDIASLARDPSTLDESALSLISGIRRLPGAIREVIPRGTEALGKFSDWAGQSPELSRIADREERFRDFIASQQKLLPAGDVPPVRRGLPEGDPPQKLLPEGDVPSVERVPEWIQDILSPKPDAIDRERYLRELLASTEPIPPVDVRRSTLMPGGEGDFARGVQREVYGVDPSYGRTGSRTLRQEDVDPPQYDPSIWEGAGKPTEVSRFPGPDDVPYPQPRTPTEAEKYNEYLRKVYGVDEDPAIVAARAASEEARLDDWVAGRSRAQRQLELEQANIEQRRKAGMSPDPLNPMIPGKGRTPPTPESMTVQDALQKSVSRLTPDFPSAIPGEDVGRIAAREQRAQRVRELPSAVLGEDAGRIAARQLRAQRRSARVEPALTQEDLLTDPARVVTPTAKTVTPTVKTGAPVSVKGPSAALSRAGKKVEESLQEVGADPEDFQKSLSYNKEIYGDPGIQSLPAETETWAERAALSLASQGSPSFRVLGERGSPLTKNQLMASESAQNQVKLQATNLVAGLVAGLKKAGKVGSPATVEKIRTKERSRLQAMGMSAAKRSAMPAPSTVGDEAMNIKKSLKGFYAPRKDQTLPKPGLDHAAIVEELGGPENKDKLLVLFGEAGPIGNDLNKNFNYNALLVEDHGNASVALENLLEKGELPSVTNMDHISRVLGKEVGDELVNRRRYTRFGFTLDEFLLDIIQSPRSAISSLDFSFFGRQAGFLIPAEGKIMKDAVRLIADKWLPRGEEAAVGMERAMQAAENGDAWRNYVGYGGIFIHRFTGSKSVARILGNREEAYMSVLAGYLPWVKGSERIHAMFLNKVRWDTMDKVVKNYEKAIGRQLDPVNDIGQRQFLGDLGEFVNLATGRGPSMETVAGKIGGEHSEVFQRIGRVIDVLMNSMMFSPKLWSSRMLYPVYGLNLATQKALPRAMKKGVNLVRESAKGDQVAAYNFGKMSRIVSKQMGAWFAMGTTILGLASWAALTSRKERELFGVTVPSPASGDIDAEVDPRATNFGKIRVGKTWYDIWSGEAQIARAMGQLITGKRKSAQTGQVVEADKSETLGRFFRSKFAPQVGLVSDYNLLPFVTKGPRFGQGIGFLGEDRDIRKDWKRLPVRIDPGMGALGLRLDDESLMARMFGPLFLRDMSNAVDEEMSPTIPSNLDTRSTLTSEHPSLSKQFFDILAGTAKSIPGFGGVGMTSYTTLDDIAAEITKDRPGGSTQYKNLYGPERKQVQDIRKQREDMETALFWGDGGMTRSQSLGFKIDKIKVEQAKLYQVLADDLAAKRINIWEARTKYNDEKSRAASAIKNLIDAEGISPSERNPIEQRVIEFYDSVEELEKTRGSQKGLERYSLTSEEYEEFLTQWEIKMINSAISTNKFAVIAHRMAAFGVDIPEELLNILPVGTRARYKASRTLRAILEAGEMPKQFYIK